MPDDSSLTYSEVADVQILLAWCETWDRWPHSLPEPVVRFMARRNAAEVEREVAYLEGVR